jgi:23S rRNA-/tRNA-specific pseudouridylate synthase
MIQILAENNFFYVINKPVGFSVHNESPSIADVLKSLKKPEHFVNRLDLETSGLMVIAQKPEYHEPLSQALNQGTKTYRALLRGSLKNDVEKWTKPLTDSAEGRKNPEGLTKNRIPCFTEIRVLRKNKFFTEVDATIQTGRQHQIRKHAALAKHPVVGDKRYNDSAYNEKVFAMYDVKRMFLHARKLEFKFGFKNDVENYTFELVDFSLDHFFRT